MKEIDQCSFHKPKELGYIQWHIWSEEQQKKGRKQKQCPVCKKWFYNCEFGSSRKIML